MDMILVIGLYDKVCEEQFMKILTIDINPTTAKIN